MTVFSHIFLVAFFLNRFIDNIIETIKNGDWKDATIS
jgi:hypothetical protein